MHLGIPGYYFTFENTSLLFVFMNTRLLFCTCEKKAIIVDKGTCYCMAEKLSFESQKSTKFLLPHSEMTAKYEVERFAVSSLEFQCMQGLHFKDSELLSH